MSKTVVNKVTKVVWDNGFKPDGVNIPSVTSADQGKVLSVDSNGKWVAASPAAPQSELPEYSAADEGKILKVDDQGALEWADDDNTQYTAGDNVSIVDGEISAVDTTYTAGDNVAISADNEISSVNTIVFNAKYFRATDTFQYDADAVAPFLTEVYKNDKRAIVRVQDGNYNIFDIYTLQHYESGNKMATFTKTNPSIVSANQREIICAHIGLAISNGTGTLVYTTTGVTDLPNGASAGQVAVSDGHSGWVAADIPSELPSVSASDEGKVLKVDANGDWAVGTDEDTKYTAGTNVQINGGVISATDTTYSDATTTDAGLMSAADKTKLNGIETGAEVNVNADWNAVSGDAQILNKPNFATVATSGDYTDLINKPTIPSYSAGTNVQINDGVISATDTTYSAGSGISITGTVIAADAQLPAVTSVDEGKVLKVDNNGTWAVGSDDNTTYSAGTNITIDANNQISAVDTTYSAGTGITITGTTIAADSQLPAYSATESGKVLSVDGNGDLEWATPSSGGGVMMPDPTNVLKTTTSITSTNTTYTATQDCYVSFALTGATGTSASSGLDFYVIVQKSGASPSVSPVLYEAGGRSLGNANVAPAYKGGFYLKSGWYATITSTIHATGTSFGEYTVYALA